jgi:TPP-dependent trihydroxycyclohexane-1,2-dione (THcHDO) dehydratase
MLRKFVVLALMGLGVVVSGCGNDCDDAADRITAKAEECGLPTTDGDGGDAEVECTEEVGAAAQCTAGCFEAASCETLKGEDADGALDFADCLSGC